MFYLTVEYSVSKYPGFGLDSKIVGLVGRPVEGTGTDLKSMTRDMNFPFEDEASAKRALARVKKQKLRAFIEAV